MIYTIIGIIAALVGGFFYQKSKASTAEALNTNLDVKKQVNDIQSQEDKNNAALAQNQQQQTQIQGEIKILFNKNQISFSSNNVYLTSRVIDGIFPDYAQIIPKEFKTECVVLKQDLLNALKLSNIFSDKFNQVNLKIKPKEKVFELSSQNNEIGENKTYLDAAVSGEEVEVSFNYKYFIDCLQSINSDSVSIKFNQSVKPMVISGVSDNSFLYLIMPMNR